MGPRRVVVGHPGGATAGYVVSHGFFKKGEIADVGVRHLGVDGEMTTRDLAERVRVACDLEVSDAVLRNSAVVKVVQALRHARCRKLVRRVKKRKDISLLGHDGDGFGAGGLGPAAGFTTARIS